RLFSHQRAQLALATGFGAAASASPSICMVSRHSGFTGYYVMSKPRPILAFYRRGDIMKTRGTWYGIWQYAARVAAGPPDAGVALVHPGRGSIALLGSQVSKSRVSKTSYAVQGRPSRASALVRRWIAQCLVSRSHSGHCRHDRDARTIRAIAPPSMRIR